MLTRRSFAALATLGVAGAALQPRASSAAGAPEKSSVQIAIGGKSLMVYLPVVIADRKGFFKSAGVNVELVEVDGGSKALQALIGGSVDATSGSFDHTIQMQAKSQSIRGVVLFAKDPGIVFAVTKAKADAYKSPKDLKGMTIGVTAPGSQTNFMLNHILVSNGMAPEDVSIVGIGGGPSAVAAVQNARVDALSNADPVITQLQEAGDIKIIYDTRTSAGSKAVFGADYPSGTIYMKTDFISANPNTVQAIANGMVKALKWIATASPEEIADAVPPEFTAGNKKLYIDCVKNSKEMYSTDGKFSMAGAEAAQRVLSAFDPSVKSAKIDLASTFTNEFVNKAADMN
jgi:NitT/TauT family transport system substrate-binding protein